MIKSAKMSTKIAGLAGILIILGGLIALVAYESLGGVLGKEENVNDMNRLVQMMLATRVQERNFIIHRDQRYATAVHQQITDLKRQIKESATGFQDTADRKLTDDALTAVSEYGRAFENLSKLQGRADALEAVDGELARSAGDLEKAAGEIRQGEKAQYAELMKSSADMDKLKAKLKDVDDAETISRLTLQARIREKDFLLKGNKKYVDAVSGYAKGIVKLGNEMGGRLSQAQDKGLAGHIVTAAQAYQAAFENMVAYQRKEAQAKRELETAAAETVKVCRQARADQESKMQSEVSRADNVMMIGSLLAMVLGILLSFLIIQALSKGLKPIIEGLNEGSEQVAAASGQISTASQALAEGSSEQAASIEETSSSLEEMSSMTKQNADNAGQADSLMKDANQVVEKANEAMRQLTLSMEEISKAGKETQKIVKTIDEIAFQTNLLALNAAVEAARAGEAGSGFAVVADEVRNLAMRAADAAKNTANLIEGTVKKVQDGGEIVAKTNQAFTEVSESAVKVGQLVAEIAAASNEQAQGIEQVNIAVSEMDKVVQQNAANAEESASASEEMNAQAEQMRGMVGELIALVGGTSHNGNGSGRRRIRIAHATADVNGRKAALVAPEAAGVRVRNVRPAQVIPLDQEDFEDF